MSDKAFDVSIDTLLRMQARHDAYTMRQRSDDINVQRHQPLLDSHDEGNP